MEKGNEKRNRTIPGNTSEQEALTFAHFSFKEAYHLNAGLMFYLLGTDMFTPNFVP